MKSNPKLFKQRRYTSAVDSQDYMWVNDFYESEATRYKWNMKNGGLFSFFSLDYFESEIYFFLWSFLFSFKSDFSSIFLLFKIYFSLLFKIYFSPFPRQFFFFFQILMLIEPADVYIVPAVHGTDATIAEKICQTGFAALSSLV